MPRLMAFVGGLLALLVTAAPARVTPHVYLVVVDGLDARLATPERMPRLFGLRAEEAGRTSVFVAARAVMPARTNPNHASLLTGVYPEAHGITGNAYWSRRPDAQPQKLDAASLIDVETLFTVAEDVRPGLVTYGVFAKPKLGRLFAAVPGRQRAPDVLWIPERGRDGVDATTGYATDAATMTQLLELCARAEPDLAAVNLADVDRTAHATGPESEATRAAVATADAAVARLVDDLRARGRWARSVLLVTADHGFDAVAPTPERPSPVISLGPRFAETGVGGVLPVSDGGLEHVYAIALTADATDAGISEDVLVRAAGVARQTPGVVEVLSRLPIPGVPLLEAVHPDWHLEHERAGDLVLIAARGYQFIDPRDPVEAVLSGNHGGPGETTVPLVVSGGYPGLRAATTPMPTLADVAPTIAMLLALRLSERVDGRPLERGVRGRAMDAVLDPSVRDRTVESSS